MGHPLMAMSPEDEIGALHRKVETQKKVLIWLAGGQRGASATFMAVFLTTWDPLNETPYQNRPIPQDMGDFRRCLNLLALAPELRKTLPLMANASERWAHLVKVWPPLEEIATSKVSPSDELGKRLNAALLSISNGGTGRRELGLDV